MPTFFPDEIKVFYRSGLARGILPKWNVDQPRTYRFNEVEDFTFSIPRYDMDTDTYYLTDAVVNELLLEDNLIYVQNETQSMRGWAGAITNVRYGSEVAVVRCSGLLGLFRGLESELFEQEEGFVWTIAQHLVLAAQAKQAAHGDFLIGFQHDETPGSFRRNFGRYEYEGDVLSGLQSLMSNTVSEGFVHARVNTTGNLEADLRWGGRWHIDNRDIVLRDGEDGNLMPGHELNFSAQDLVNRVRLRGATTDLGRYVDYGSVRSVIRDITPEVELTLDADADPQHRRREELDLTVQFGYPALLQRDLAAQIQDRYLGFYKSFLFAYHDRLGRPFLEGYDWEGPDGHNDKKLSGHYFRSWNRIAVIGEKQVIYTNADDDDVNFIEARFDDWQFQETISPVDNPTGVAMDWSDPDQRFVADGDTGDIWELQSDLETKEVLLHVTASGETLVGVATDPSQPTVIWALVTAGGASKVRTYTISNGAMVAEWSVPGFTANDIAVQSNLGLVWLTGSGTGDLQAHDISTGIEITDTALERYTFPTGTTPVGFAMTGDLAYVTDASGNVRFLFANEGGNLAGTLATGVASSGMFVDVDGGKVWLIRSDGSINTYRAHIAIGSLGGGGDVIEGSPGFDRLTPNQPVRIVMRSDIAASPHPRDKIAIVYSPGRYVNQTIETGIGQPDVIQRTWVTGEQKFAIVKRSAIWFVSIQRIYVGEESRVDDWNPKEDGYGDWGTAVYRTRKGNILRTYKRWFFRDWDIPDSEFYVDPPEWTDGLAYLADYLALRNKRRPVQVLSVTNKGDLFRKLTLGGEYTVEISLQGPPGGFTGVLRLLAYTPDESQGRAELIGEWVT